MSNCRLVEYGIFQEQSDIRAHVCVKAKRVYIYHTKQAIEVLRRKPHRLVPAYQHVNGRKLKTAEGYLVKPIELYPCKSIPVTRQLLTKYPIRYQDSTTIKGANAAGLVMALINGGQFPFMLHGENITDYDLQLKGVDIHVSMKARIQVKCDYNGGERRRGGTGNLFLQVRESNPLRSY